jgi:hypothetical protein
MAGPLWEALPLLDLARKAVPALEYLRVRRWFELREKRREAQESLRRGLALSEQMCALHGHPEASGSGMSIALGSPLWCGCNWKTDFTREGTRALFFHRRDPGTGVTLGAVFCGPPDADQLRALREAFSDG